MSEAKKPTLWKVLTFGGSGLLIAAVGTLLVDLGTMGQYQLIDTHDGIFWLAILFGMSFLFAGLIGLANRRGSRGTIGTGVVVLAVTIWIVGSNVQRPFSLFVWPVIAASFIGIVLILRASFRRKE
jgi:lipopolysaccharide export LptBFGC system permease protein LptF